MDLEPGEWRGSVIVGIVPDLPSRVLEVAAEYARLRGAGLVVASVDVTRFVTYEDPDGTAHTAPIDLDVASAATTADEVRAQAAAHLDTAGVRWTLSALVGDPAMAIKTLADRIESPLIVVGTRRRGIGETIREFFTGSVAARLAHRQKRPVLVVPLQEPVSGDEPWA